MRGLPVEAVQLETAKLDPYKVLLLTYEGQKPPNEQIHHEIAQWVRNGGALIVIDNDKDPYNKVREWWNTNGHHLATPRYDLFDLLGVPRNKVGLTHVGKGVVIYDDASPADLSHSDERGHKVRQLTKQAMKANGTQWKETGSLVLRRGPYIIAGGLDDHGNAGAPFVLHGKFIPLFDSTLPVISQYTVTSGSRAVLTDLNAMPQVGVVAAACRVRGVKIESHSITFNADGVAKSDGIILIKMPSAPRSVTVDSQTVPANSYAFTDGLLRMQIENRPKDQQVSVTW